LFDARVRLASRVWTRNLILDSLDRENVREEQHPAGMPARELVLDQYGRAIKRALGCVVGVVVPGRRLGTRNDSSDVRVFTFRGGRLRRLAILRFLPSRRLRLLFFLAGAFAGAFVLGRT
jgi:hypothetical protein